uniref:Uncharacterized protein n=1 Tax=Rhizophora mucronata TaxID=61149 RepID=A0A2P2QSG5_RHIMU
MRIYLHASKASKRPVPSLKERNNH